MISPPLAERPTVRRAAVKLCRALMREAGVRLVDLQEQRAVAPAPVSSARPQLVTPIEQPLTRALKRAGLGPRNKAVDGVIAPKFALAATGDVIVPPGVKVTLCPSGRDTRYLVEGPVLGEFTLDWIAKRGGHR